MAMRRSLAARVVFTFCAVLLVPGAGVGLTPASAATISSVMVQLAGTVDGEPESVAFSGQAQVKAKVVDDPDFGTPARVILSIDLSKVVGIGSSTRKRYVTTTQEFLNRPLSVADLFEVPFTFFPSGQRGASARVGLATFNMGFDMATGQLTGAEAEVVPPAFSENDEQ